MKEVVAYRKVSESLKNGPLNMDELLKTTKISKGSLHRWIIQWKKEGKIEERLRVKKEGIGPETEFLCISSLVNRIEKELMDTFQVDISPNKKGNYKWVMNIFFKIIAQELNVNYDSDEFQNAISVVMKRNHLFYEVSDTT